MSIYKKTFQRIIVQATIVDLRYKTKEVLAAVERKEPVTITYRGKDKFKITNITNSEPAKKTSCRDFDFIGSDQENSSTDEVMKSLRGGRYADL